MDPVKFLNEYCKNSLIEHLGIEFTETGENFIAARMPVDHRTIQPMKILHGGASIALAETVAGAGSFLLIDTSKHNIVGMQVNANHIGSVSSGYVLAHATLLHKGTKTHVWDVIISDGNGIKVSACRVTNMIIEKT